MAVRLFREGSKIPFGPASSKQNNPNSSNYTLGGVGGRVLTGTGGKPGRDKNARGKGAAKLGKKKVLTAKVGR